MRSLQVLLIERINLTQIKIEKIEIFFLFHISSSNLLLRRVNMADVVIFDGEDAILPVSAARRSSSLFEQAMKEQLFPSMLARVVPCRSNLLKL
jgi:radical SAM superfamily enzyme with C-terminal helix-hairpin-helix motif